MIDGEDLSRRQQELTSGQLVTMSLVHGTVDSDVASECHHCCPPPLPTEEVSSLDGSFLLSAEGSVSQYFWFLVCYANTQLATQLQQRCTQVVCSNKEARKRLTESNRDGTPAMDLGHMNVVLKETFAFADIQTNKE